MAPIASHRSSSSSNTTVVRLAVCLLLVGVLATIPSSANAGCASHSYSSSVDYCSNHGSCSSWSDEMCDCDEGYYGDRCESYFPTYAPIPIVTEGVCDNSWCGNHGDCTTDSLSGKQCACFGEYYGERCQSERGGLTGLIVGSCVGFLVSTVLIVGCCAFVCHRRRKLARQNDIIVTSSPHENSLGAAACINGQAAYPQTTVHVAMGVPAYTGCAMDHLDNHGVGLAPVSTTYPPPAYAVAGSAHPATAAATEEALLDEECAPAYSESACLLPGIHGN